MVAGAGGVGQGVGLQGAPGPVPALHGRVPEHTGSQAQAVPAVQFKQLSNRNLVDVRGSLRISELDMKTCWIIIYSVHYRNRTYRYIKNIQT